MVIDKLVVAKVFEKDVDVNGLCVLPKHVKGIGKDAFSRCSGVLKSVVIPNNVEFIENGAFEDCCVLEKVQMSKNIKSIGENAFQNCHNLQKIAIGDKIESIGENAFMGVNANNVDVPFYIHKQNLVYGFKEKTFQDVSFDIER